MGHPRTGRRARGARGCLCRAPALARGLLTSGIPLVASASALLRPPFLHRQGEKWVRGQHSLPPQRHQQNTRARPGPDLCLPRASWPRLARARLGKGLPCQAGPLQPAPGAAPGPLLTPHPAGQASAQHQHWLLPGAWPRSPRGGRQTPPAATTGKQRRRRRPLGWGTSSFPKARQAGL